MQRRPVALRPVMEAALEAIRPDATAKGVTIEIMLSGDAVVLGDVLRLEQVVTNVLGNAMKFTPPGRAVHVSLEKVGDAARIIVRDEGEGIDAEFLPHAFEPFRQAEDVRKRTNAGLGLGLAIVKSLVEDHGGEVQVASEGRDRGATFTITLPVASSTRAREVSGCCTSSAS